MAGIGYSPYTGAGNLASAFGANPNFGGSVGGYGGGTGGYQSGGYSYPNNVGGVNYSGAAPSGYAWGANGLVPIGQGQAGIQAYNPAISTSPTRSFQAPSFTNSMSNWYSAGNANTPSRNASEMMGQGAPGGGSDLEQWYAEHGYSSGGGDYSSPGMGGSVANTMAGYAGGGMGYPAYGLSNLAWATGSPTLQQANATLSDIAANQPRTLSWNGQPNYAVINNNPGNLQSSNPVAGTNIWSQRFGTYPTMSSGINALQNNLYAYGNVGRNTPYSIASAWAPPGPQDNNNTTLYAQRYMDATGAPSMNTQLNMNDPWTNFNLSQGTVTNEIGPGGSTMRGAIANAPQNQVYANAANAAINGLYGAGQQWVGHGGH